MFVIYVLKEITLHHIEIATEVWNNGCRVQKGVVIESYYAFTEKRMGV